MSEMVRLNTRISRAASEWLEEESHRTGVSKSALVYLALENYIQQKESMRMMADMGQIVEAIERLEKRLSEDS